jgi:uncharacterized glyoxalase superfamily protein PhnB
MSEVIPTRVGHAEITIGSSRLMLADEHPELGAVSPATLGGSRTCRSSSTWATSMPS